MIQLNNIRELAMSQEPSNQRNLENDTLLDIQKDIPYSDNNEPVNTYTLILPPLAKSSPPLLIWMHTGAWVQYIPGQYDIMVEKLANEAGIATALLRYTIKDPSKNVDGKFPVSIKDCLKGIIHILKNEARYNYDNRKIVIGGHSAGGFLSALALINSETYLPVTNSSKESELSLLANIRGLCTLAALFDLELLPKTDLKYIDRFIQPIFGPNTKQANSQLTTWQSASPQYVSKSNSDKVQYVKTPEFLLIHSTDDTLVERNQTENFESHIRTLGFPDGSSYIDALGDHFEVQNNPKVINKIGRFVTKVTYSTKANI